jgi:hypothetical protein
MSCKFEVAVANAHDRCRVPAFRCVPCAATPTLLLPSEPMTLHASSDYSHHALVSHRTAGSKLNVSLY